LGSLFRYGSCAMSYSVIDLQHVAKAYPGGVEALRSVAMTVDEGEIFGLLGPNGAGKSTLVKILLTLVRPDKIQGEVLGKPVGNRAALGQIGYLPEQARFPEYLTGRQVLNYIGGLQKVPRGRRKKRSDELIKLVKMEDHADRPVSAYSKGMRQRLGLAQALINRPSLVFLDEPTDGLDPIGRMEIAEVLRELRRQNVTIFLNSHLLGEAEKLCDRVAILSGGRIIKQGTVEDLTCEGGSYELRIVGELPPLPSVAQLVSALGGQIEYSATDHLTTITLKTSRSQLLQPVIDELRRFGITIETLTPRRRSLEQLFLEAVGQRQGMGGFGEDRNGPATMMGLSRTLLADRSNTSGDRQPPEPSATLH
jgi:ABC-2 type transport system ATP-binding protein